MNVVKYLIDQKPSTRASKTLKEGVREFSKCAKKRVCFSKVFQDLMDESLKEKTYKK